MVAVTTSTTNQNLKFKNVLGCLKLQLKGTASIKSISVTGNNNEILCGDASVAMAPGNIPSIILTDQESKTVTLDCGTGVQLNAETATSFVIALPAMTMTKGFTILIKDTENGHMEVKTSKSQTITRSSILKMPVVDHDGTDYTLEPLTITSVGNSTISIEKTGDPNPVILEHRKGIDNWSAYSIGTSIDLTDGQSLQFKAGENGNNTFSKNEDEYYQIVSQGSGVINISGNIISLLDSKLEKNTMPAYGFIKLFNNCNKLVEASKLKLPTAVLANSCYSSMFFGCTSLTNAPELPATVLANSCYSSMFFGCTSLTNAPELPATVLANSCYSSMFFGCTSLTNAPELPATVLADYCYGGMFNGCSSLTQAPELPATTLAKSCYGRMFYKCELLNRATELPATTLAKECYSNMFEGTSLSKAPELPATTLASDCYVFMFNGCTNLNYVKALFTTEPSELYTNQWLEDVASKGTLIKNKNASWNVTGPNGVPSGWDIEFE